jgi:prostaglandin-endoperoxide synthase 2
MFGIIPGWLLKLLFDLVQKWPWLYAKANAFVINLSVNGAPHRPYAYSTFSDYVCWTSLSDKRYSARHLPPKRIEGLPAKEKCVELFRRPPGAAQEMCAKSTCLFPAFAQYLTDGFIRTRMPHGNEPQTLRRHNTSNHQIDMCTLYGRVVGQTLELRLRSEEAGRRGRLKTQTINGEEYSPFLYDPGTGKVKEEFKSLDPPLGISTVVGDAGKRDALFAAGGDRINASPQIAMINTLFLREHNRLAGEMEKAHPDWNDQRVFETARNVIIVMFIKIVVEQYINHIVPLPFRLRADPSVAWNAPWNKPNWITTEFSLLYRWHSLMPDTLRFGKNIHPVGTLLLDVRPLIECGLLGAFVDISAQTAAKLGHFNTHDDILMGVETLAIVQSRVCDVAPYVEYRKYVGLSVPKRFEDLSKDPAVAAFLKNTYHKVEDIEFYVGLFAEDTVANSPLPELILRMVAVDAFSQALTNPLLSEHVFNEATFTKYGWHMINTTATLGDILERNIPGGIGDAQISMTRADWRWKAS